MVYNKICKQWKFNFVLSIGSALVPDDSYAGDVAIDMGGESGGAGALRHRQAQLYGQDETVRQIKRSILCYCGVENVTNNSNAVSGVISI